MPLVPCPACRKAPTVIRESTVTRIGCDSPGCLETPVIRGGTLARAEHAWTLYVEALRFPLLPAQPRTEKGTTGIPMKETTGLRWARDRTRAPVVLCIDDMSEPP